MRGISIKGGHFRLSKLSLNLNNKYDNIPIVFNELTITIVFWGLLSDVRAYV